MRDIVMVRGALFPETLVASSGGSGGSAGEGELRGDLDDDLDLSKKSSATEKSIDELLASLGMDDDDDDFKFDDLLSTKSDEEKDAEDQDGINDEKMTAIMDELQIWRSRNVSSPYESWDVDRKTEFDVSIHLVLNQTILYVLLSLTPLIHVFRNHLHSNGSIPTLLCFTQMPTLVVWIRRPRAYLSCLNVQSIPRKPRSSGAVLVPKLTLNYS
jgi:hypothetical protein